MIGDRTLSIREEDGSQRVVRASHGIMHILFLRHVAALKYHYLFRAVRAITVTEGRMRGGMPRMGEGEPMAALMQGMPATVRDAVVSSDMVEADICSGCRRLVINCDCSHPKPSPTKIMAKYPLIVLGIHMTVATLNSSTREAVGLTYITRT